MSLIESERCYVYCGVVDLRKGPDRLRCLVGRVEDGVVYLFSNRSRELLKYYAQDGAGVWCGTRRLHRGRFAWPESAGGGEKLTGDELVVLLVGWDVRKHRLRRTLAEEESHSIRRLITQEQETGFKEYAERLEKELTQAGRQIRELNAELAYAKRQLGCWAHARRKFYEAWQHGEEGAVNYLLDIRELYAIEAKLPDNDMKERLRIRQEQSRPVLARIKTARQTDQEKHLHKSAMGDALGYLGNQWDKLTAYIDHPDTRIDNNLTDQARGQKLAVHRFAPGRTALRDHLHGHRIVPTP